MADESRSDSSWSVAVQYRARAASACQVPPVLGYQQAQHRRSTIRCNPPSSRSGRLALGAFWSAQDGREDAAAFDVSCHELK